MAKLVIRTATVGGKYKDTWAIYWDTHLHTVLVDRLTNSIHLTSNVDHPVNEYDWTLIFANNAGLNGDITNIEIATNTAAPTDYDIGDTTEVQMYDLIPDRLTVTATALIDDSFVSLSAAALQTLVSISTDVGGAAVTLNDLELENVYVTYTGTGASTVAAITVVASGTNTPLTYYLGDSNSSTGQASGSFTGVTVVEDAVQLITVTDANGNEVTDTIRLFTQSSYGARWRVQYDNFSSDTISCNIYEKGYVGSLTDLDGASDFPFENTYRQGSSSDAKYDIIKGSESIVNINATTSFQLLDLFEGDEDSYLLIMDRDGTEEWRGFAQNEGYTEAYADTPYPVKAKFHCGLGALKSIDFIDDTGDLYTGIKSGLEIVKICLLYTLHQLPIYVSLDVFAQGQSEAADNTPLEQTYFNLDAFQEDGKPFNCYEVIEHVLKPWGAHVFQEKGAWHIRNIDNLQTTYTQTQFNAFGASGSDSVYNPSVTLTTAVADPARRIQGTLSMIPGWKEALIDQTVKQYNNIIRNGDFQTIDKNKKFTNWTDANNISKVDAVQDGDEAKNFMLLVGDDAGVSNMAADTRIITVSKDGTRFTLNIQYIVRGDAANVTDFEQRFDMQIGPYLLKKNGQWTNDTSTPTSELLYFNNSSDGHVLNGTNTINITTAPLPDGGGMQFKIYRAKGTGQVCEQTEIINANLRSVENKILLPEKFEYNYPNLGNFTFKPDPVELLFGDWDDFDNPSSTFRNTMYVDAQGTDPTNNWSRSGVTENLAIQDILGLRMASNYNGPTQEVAGKIITKNDSIDFSNVISDPENSGKKFMLSSLTKREGTSEQSYKVTMLEILSEDTSVVYRVWEAKQYRWMEGTGIGWNVKLRILES